MHQVEINLPKSLPAEPAITIIERTAAELGLVTTLRGTLQAYPGSVHWHLKKGRGRGVLEATLWPTEQRLWLTVHQNRDAPWIAEVMPELCQRIESYIMAV